MGGTVATRTEEIKTAKSLNTHVTGVTDGENVEMLVQFMYPIYYNREVLTPLEKEKAIHSFRLISTNQAEEFYRLKQEDPGKVTCASPMEFFGNRFYKRLLEIHPTCQPLFGKSTLKQGSLLFRMMTLVVSDLEAPDEEKFKKTFEAIAHSHNRIGVRSAECKLKDRKHFNLYL